MDFEDLAPTLIRLARQDLANCFDLMTQFYQDHKSQDLDGWLARSISLTRAHFYIQHRRYQEALDELSAAGPMFAPHSPENRERLTSMALALEGSGQTEDALRQLDDALMNDPEMPPNDVLSTLLHYARICQAHDMEMPSRLNKPLMDAIDRLGLPVPAEARERSLVRASLLAHKLRTDPRHAC
jgi:tetratricopeptide (TPR) repeat protein